VVIARRPDSRWKAGVLVGADGTAESRPVVEFAFQLASFRNLPLTVMHASFDPYLPDDTAREALASGAAASYGLLLAESVSGLSETYPDVHVMRRLGRGLVDEQLTRNLHPWDVVVVGRHQPRRRLGTVGATVATSVLERFRGVVAVVPEATEVRATDDETW
jgi:nucleotide-binding universal stress UspA family protein